MAGGWIWMRPAARLTPERLIMESVGTLVGQFGLSVGLVIFFVWIGWQREIRMVQDLASLGKQCDELQAEFRRSLSSLIANHNECMAKHTDTLEELADTVRTSNKEVTGLLIKLSERPCLVPGIRDHAKECGH